MVQARDVMEVLNRDILSKRGLGFSKWPRRLTGSTGPWAIGAISGPPDRRLAQLRQAIEAILEPGPGRAETVQRIFSLDYNADWQKTFGLDRRGSGV